ncbi:DUF1445 domain-containing protein [archaeon]|nr:MAG: DUF1445 domain-containing protein [archaeon]
MYYGDAAGLGIADISRPDYGDAVTIYDGVCHHQPPSTAAVVCVCHPATQRACTHALATHVAVVQMRSHCFGHAASHPRLRS